MVLLIDNFDSFTYNLAQYLYQLDVELLVRRNNAITLEEIAALENLDAIVLSPGPGRPENAGIMVPLIRHFAGRVPMLGVCLGHQAIGCAFGGEVVRARRLMHGKLSSISHDGQGLFAGLKQNFAAVRYHSLALNETTLPPELMVTARSEDGEVMGVRHREFVLEGIQYHPESILSANGKRQLANFLALAAERKGV
ncbi:aminodeoxychorismate/anthranilate synthase component II [Victivallis sp. Marseille-Q1083]|uniref:anthranilate synthase component II n=1 Tax=Victivallis sp. Marseille-Q1083 TaxID=2717288 RepID=UPI00158DCAB0|nr:aminodeoxychorismate/anthranilate synthase component II [Victivallis sp. Marseille-Q1083]